MQCTVIDLSTLIIAIIAALIYRAIQPAGGFEMSPKGAAIIGWTIVIFVLAVFATPMEVLWTIRF